MSYMMLANIGLLIQILFIYVEQQKQYIPAVVLKGTAALCFVVLGFLGLAYAPTPSFAKVVVAGLVFGFIGDVCLNLRFVLEKAGQKIFLAGIAAFLVGHILYLAALIPLCSKVWLWLLIGAVVAAALLFWILNSVEAEKAFKIFGVVYIGAVVLMTSVAVGVFVGNRDNQGALLYMVGAVFFTLSDIILIFNTFTKDGKRWMRPANLLLYYLGQLLIALSIQVL